MNVQTRHSPSNYFGGIDGLRAVAVLSVLLYHLNGSVPAGFVGVDVFFVISGFVVANAATSLPTQTLGNFMAAFYARRLLRIVPALVVCLLVTMTLATLLVPGGGWLSATNTKTGMAAFFGFSNVVLSLTAGDYWSPRSEFNPFTHTWSLGVEEQFYLLSPFLLFAWLRGHRRWAAAILGTLALASLVAASLAVSPSAHIFAFYSLHARFWELALGVALAFGLGRWQPVVASLPRGVQQVLALGAATALLLGLVAADNKAFPWPWALLPVLSTALLIVSVIGAKATFVGRILASVPALWVGKRSYSLYLWHWPVFVLFRWTVGLEGMVEQSVAVALSLLLAAASYRYVEQPVRYSQFASRLDRWKVATLGLLALLCCGGAAASVAAARPWINLSVTRDLSVWDAYGDLPAPGARCTVIATEQFMGGEHRQTFKPQGCTADPRTLFVAGDSHAGAYTAMLKKLVRESGMSVELFTGPGCSVFGLGGPTRLGRPECIAFTRSMLNQVNAVAKAGDLFFLPGLRVPRLRDQWGGVTLALPGNVEARAEAVAEATQTLLPLAQRGVKVVFEAPKPVFKAPPFRCSDWFNSHNPICQGGLETKRAEVEERRAQTMGSMQAVVATLPGATIWDPLPVLCPADTCSSYQDGKPLFFDGDHLSGFGNSKLVGSFEKMVGPMGVKSGG